MFPIPRASLHRVSAFELDTSVGAGEGAALCTVECTALEMAPVWRTSPKGTSPLTLPRPALVTDWCQPGSLGVGAGHEHPLLPQEGLSPPELTVRVP